MVHKNARRVNERGVKFSLQAGRQRVGGAVTHHGGPGANLPFGDEATGHIRVVARELLDQVPGRRREEQDCPIYRVRERPGEQQFATAHRGAGMLQMRSAKLGPAFQYIGDVVIEEEVMHVGRSAIARGAS